MDQDVSQQTLNGAPSPRRSSRDVARWARPEWSPTGELIHYPLNESERKRAARLFWKSRTATIYRIIEG